MPAAMADKVSLSPNLLMCKISDTEMVSFSLMMGMTPRESRVESVVVALRYRERCRWSVLSQFYAARRRKRRNLTSAMSFLVMRICAMGCLRAPKI